MTTMQERIAVSLSTEHGLEPMLEEAGNAAAVLIGTASHGARELALWRNHITRRLIQDQGFSFVAIEADWPGCYEVNRVVKGVDDTSKSPRDALASMNHWPAWMWANAETLEFVTWLAEYNRERPYGERVGFYGIDLYSLWNSLSIAIAYLKENVPFVAHDAVTAYACLEPFRKEIEAYPWTAEAAPLSCQAELDAVLQALEHVAPVGVIGGAEALLNARQNALSAVNAVRYYRSMNDNVPDSWNLREEHMAHTFFNLLNFHTSPAMEPKGVIWAHDTHVGDARAINQSETDRVSLGQIVRDSLSAGDTYVIGSGFYQGTVVAADDWNRPAQDMVAPPALRDSWEEVLHRDPGHDVLLRFGGQNESGPFTVPRDHREIGVVYDPKAEFGNYISVKLASRYDAFLFSDTVSAINPMPVEADLSGPPSTYPSAA